MIVISRCAVSLAAGSSCRSSAAWLIAPSGIAHLVRDVGGEPAERGELHLARFGLYARQVLEENDRARAAPPSDRHEARAHRARERHVARGVAAVLVLAPRLEAARERRRVFGERDVAAAPQRPQDALGARVELPDDAVPVDDEHAVLHVLDHVLAHLRHVLEIDLALRRELFARDRVLRERVRDPRDHEIRRARAAPPARTARRARRSAARRRCARAARAMLASAA